MDEKVTKSGTRVSSKSASKYIIFVIFQRLDLIPLALPNSLPDLTYTMRLCLKRQVFIPLDLNILHTDNLQLRSERSRENEIKLQQQHRQVEMVQKPYNIKAKKIHAKLGEPRWTRSFLLAIILFIFSFFSQLLSGWPKALDGWFFLHPSQAKQSLFSLLLAIHKISKLALWIAQSIHISRSPMKNN